MDRAPLYQVDAFTDVPFRGNPAAVCLLPMAENDVILQAVATEMNLSETAFVLRTDQRQWSDGDTFSLRWFTPKTEVRLCGHATLATAAVLFDVIGVTARSITFETLSGPLKARKTKEGIALEFPLDPPTPCDTPDNVLAALHLRRDQIEASACGKETRKLLLHLKDATTLRQLSPDFSALLGAASMEAYRGLIVTAAGSPPFDFISRYFAPWVGINEDPVTGSAHTLLAPYWSQRLGQPDLYAHQASARGGELQVRLLEKERVEILGRAALIFEGYINLS